jgi:hypothetical protein
MPLSGSFTTVPITAIDVSAAGLHVSAGQQLAITMLLDSSGGGSPPWTIWADGTAIPGSQEYISSPGTWNTSTGAFPVRTLVTVPEPSGLALSLAGGLCLLGYRWRSRKRPA